MIQVRYEAVDGAKARRSYKGIEAARAFAVKMVGASPEFGSYYAVSADGIGKVTVQGASLAELFGIKDEADPMEAWHAEEDRFHREQLEAAYPRPAAVPEGAVAVMWESPIRCQIRDGIIGSSRTAKPVASIAEAGRIVIEHYEDGDDEVGAWIAVGKDGRWERLQYPHVIGPAFVDPFDDMPF